jgi:hypothetical protein
MTSAIKPTMMRRAGQATSMGETRNAYKIIVQKCEGRDYLGHLSIDGKIILNCILKTEYEKVHWIHLVEDRNQWPVPYMEKTFLTTSTNINVSRISLLRGVSWLVGSSCSRDVVCIRIRYERAPWPGDPHLTRAVPKWHPNPVFQLPGYQCGQSYCDTFDTFVQYTFKRITNYVFVINEGTGN